MICKEFSINEEEFAHVVNGFDAERKVIFLETCYSSGLTNKIKDAVVLCTSKKTEKSWVVWNGGKVSNELYKTDKEFYTRSIDFARKEIKTNPILSNLEIYTTDQVMFFLE
ncbi:hypothetical protein EIN_326210 [Entamoeba invadens IP1]|uniref:Uncharacterized protein n=1 Tax=Entamoeba invadens IP1 TaxID=370355 RepID=L7FN36_ENTIV|nr:hypothetical protein EIN_326210 [Entamoeba invadens IP1]ELP87560.1 hypothetical protein EIN_326210 [Entamoeba invadens IP1]|eukprot:XP_004254331.1 hypothetical protein EIN_326210 [Entamoeba invadens IP1]